MGRVKKGLRYFGFCIVLTVVVCLIGSTDGFSARKQELRIAFDAGDTMGFDPHKQAPPDMDAFVNAAIYRGLVRFKPGDVHPEKIEPDMAESWEVSKDKLLWTFKIRKGIQWHKGFGEFTAQDAEYSLKRAMDPNKCFAARNYDAVKEVKALDRYTLQIALKHPIPSLLGLLTNYHGGMMVCSRALEKYDKDYPLNPIGTGPFMFESYDPQQKTVLARNDLYFRGKPILEKIVVRYMTDLTTREFAIQKGDVDVTQGLREQQWVEKMKPYKDITVDVFGPGEIVSIFLNQSKKPLEDVRVRRALLSGAPAAFADEVRVPEVAAAVTEVDALLARLFDRHFGNAADPLVRADYLAAVFRFATDSLPPAAERDARIPDGDPRKPTAGRHALEGDLMWFAWALHIEAAELIRGTNEGHARRALLLAGVATGCAANFAWRGHRRTRAEYRPDAATAALLRDRGLGWATDFQAAAREVHALYHIREWGQED